MHLFVAASEMKPLTLILTTVRDEPRFDWFLDSLFRQTIPPNDIQVIIVDLFASKRHIESGWIHHVEPKPNVWQGSQRLTKEDWWAKSNALNTGLAMAQGEWIACCDDRCVLAPTWLEAVRDAMEGQYAVTGAYEKWDNLNVRDGVVVGGSKMTGMDQRLGNSQEIRKCPGNHFFGCSNALPLDWALEINGWDESCDGMAYEDTAFGMMLANNNRPIYYDPRMRVIQDRTPELSGPVMKREDKGISPHDKSHAWVRRSEKATRATHDINLMELRELYRNGKPWPDAPKDWVDWYDGQNIKDM